MGIVVGNAMDLSIRDRQDEWSDLQRTRLGSSLARWGIRLLTRSPVCHVDGPLSVRAAWTITEAKQLADQAGLRGAQVIRRWPERYLMVYDTDETG